MKILFLTPYFPPELGAPQTRIYELGLRLHNMGHEVSVLTTFPNYPSGVVPPEWRGFFFWKGVDAGIRIYRIWSYMAPNAGFYRRILSQLSFPVFAFLAGLRLPVFDVIIVESPPLFNGIGGMLLSAAKRAPYIFNVADLWPESAVQLGMLKNRALIWLSKKLELLIYRHSAMVLAVTESIRDAIVADGIEASKVSLCPNAVDTNFFCPNENGEDVRQELGIAPEKFMVLYAGNLGLAQQLTAVLETAEMFQRDGNNNTVHFVFAGDGAERELLLYRAQEKCLKNVTFVQPFEKKRMPKLLSAADCVLVSLRNVDIFRTVVPTKLLEAMACAKPVVLAASGEAESLLKRANAGFSTRPGDPAGIHSAVLKMFEQREGGKAMGLRGRAYIITNFSREQRVRELNDLLLGLVPPGPARDLPLSQEAA